MFNIAELKKSQVKLGTTTFIFDKMTAMQAFPVTEMIRQEISHVIGNVRAAEGMEFQAAIQVLLGARPQTVEQLRQAMFPHVQFKNPKTTPQILAGAEDMAFVKLGPQHVYQVLVQSLVVNFYDFFEDLQSKMMDVQGVTTVEESSSTQ